MIQFDPDFAQKMKMEFLQSYERLNHTRKL
jgi:hypothetical protein